MAVIHPLMGVKNGQIRFKLIKKNAKKKYIVLVLKQK